MWKALLRAGERVPRCRVRRLVRDNGIKGTKRRGKKWRTTRPDPQAQRRLDLVERDFAASRPVADLSYLRCWKGVVYFAFMIDCFSRTVVGWQLAAHMRTDLVLHALKMALRSGCVGRAPTSSSFTTQTAVAHPSSTGRRNTGLLT
jgi:putative transposase